MRHGGQIFAGITLAVAVAASIAAFVQGNPSPPTIASPPRPPAPVTFLGITIGEPAPKFPSCDPMKLFLESPCLKKESSSYGSIAIKFPSKVQEDFPFLGNTEDPGAYDEFTFLDLDSDGKVASITALTTGIKSQELALDALKDKFGEPEDSKSTKKQTLIGVNFDVIEANWHLDPDILVDFHGALGRISSGEITIQTWKYIDQKADEILNKPTPKL